MEIKSVSWKKDSHGLYDYENKDMKVEKKEITSDSIIYRQGNLKIIISNLFIFQLKGIILK